MARQFAILPFRALQDQALHPSDKLVLAALGAHTDVTGRCWPSIAKLMELSSLRERTVQRSIKRLEAMGYVEIERRDGRSTKFRVLFDTGAIEAPPPLGGVTPVPSGTHNENSNVDKSPTTATLPVQVATSLEPYITGQRYAAAAVAGVAMLLNPEASPHYAPAVVAQALVEMRAEGRPWKLSTLRSWCANLVRQAQQAPQRPAGAPHGVGGVPGVHLAPREARMADTLTQFVERHRGDQ